MKIGLIRALHCCKAGTAYAEKHKDNLNYAWKTCERGDWMVWLLGRLVRFYDDNTRTNIWNMLRYVAIKAKHVGAMEMLLAAQDYGIHTEDGCERISTASAILADDAYDTKGCRVLDGYECAKKRLDLLRDTARWYFRDLPEPVITQPVLV